MYEERSTADAVIENLDKSSLPYSPWFYSYILPTVGFHFVAVHNGDRKIMEISGAGQKRNR